MRSMFDGGQRFSSAFLFRYFPDQETMSHSVGNQPLPKCSEANFSSSIIKLILKVPNIRILCLVIKSVVPMQSKQRHKFELFEQKILFSPPITYSMFKRLELPVPERDVQEM